MEHPSELSCKYTLHGRGGVDRRVKIVATATEREKIALRLMIPGINALSCDYRLIPGRDQSVMVDGWLGAEVILECCVTGEVFEDVITEDFRVRFVSGKDVELYDGMDPDLPDEIEFDGSVVDLGSLTIEQLALALPPFPRRPDLADSASATADAVMSEEALEMEDGQKTVRPFAGLAHLLDQKSGKKS